MAVEVRTAQYSGPLDLLLHLILRNELDLYEISLAAVVDAYVTEIARMETLDLDAASEFLLIAATLLDLKSRRLLPDLSDADEADLELLEERDRLLGRLLECETFRTAATTLEELASQAELSVPRTVGPEERYLNLLPDLLAGVTAADLAAACARALVANPEPRVDISHMPSVALQVSDVVADLEAVLPAQGRVAFADLTGSLRTRAEVVVHFLALLELFKMNKVELHQAGRFGRIVVEWAAPQAEPVPAG